MPWLQICDMVAVARLMNATLVIPQLDKRSFWQDTRSALQKLHIWFIENKCMAYCKNICFMYCSTFSDIFDESHFIKALENDVHIVSELPKEMESAPRVRKHFTSWSSASYYEGMSQMWKDYEVDSFLMCILFQMTVFIFLIVYNWGLLDNLFAAILFLNILSLSVRSSFRLFQGFLLPFFHRDDPFI